MKNLFLSGLLFLGLAGSGIAATGDTAPVDVFFGGTSAKLFDFDGVTPLTNGPTTAAGDGAILQLGYYTSGSTLSTGNNFAGTWVALTGNTGTVAAPVLVNGFDTTVGDGISTATGGRFSFNVTFTEGTSAPLPTAGIPLVIRFYNNTTIGQSTYYNAVSSDTWGWLAPTTGGTTTLTLSVFDTLEWLSLQPAYNIAGSEYKTAIPLAAIPEPSTYAMLGMGLLGLVAYRRRS